MTNINSPGMASDGPVLTVYLQERWITCGMCSSETDHTEPVDRLCVPIWNGEPTTSNATKVDGYKSVCSPCYLRWNAWDNQELSKAKKVGDA